MMTKTRRISIFLSLVLLLAVLTACSNLAQHLTTGGASAPTATPSSAMTNTPAALKPGEVPDEPLAAIWAAWDILKDRFVEKDKLDAAAMSQATVKYLMDELKDPSLSATALPPPVAKPPRGMLKELKPLWDGWASIHENYKGEKPLDSKKLGVDAAFAFIKALNDPHTEYISPDRYSIDSQAFYGNYSGIGAEVHSRDGKFLLSPMPTSPAEKAGLKAGDTLVIIEGQPVENLTTFQVVSRIRGKVGTTVNITVLRLGSTEPLALAIQRDTIKLQSVFWNMTNDQFAYIRLSFFYENTPDAFIPVLQEAKAKGAKGIILDLRNNPGGFLTATVRVASQFMDEGLVLYEVDGNGKRTEWKTEKGGVALNMPLIVLVNQYSASGSEVLSGALQDKGRAKLVGMTTFGKGSVNLFRELPDGGGLYFTYARWYTPVDNRLIEGKGLDPDVQVIGGAGGRNGDVQLDEAIRLLKEQAGLPK